MYDYHVKELRGEYVYDTRKDMRVTKAAEGGNMRPNTITPTDCGNCKHWHEWPVERYTDWKPEWLHFGDCDKVPKGTKLKPTEDGTIYEFDGCAFEDENYNEEWGCFEQPEEGE